MIKDLFTTAFLVVLSWWMLYFFSRDFDEGGSFLAVITGIVIGVCASVFMWDKHGDKS